MIVSALLQPCYNLLHATCCTVYGGLYMPAMVLQPNVWYQLYKNLKIIIIAVSTTDGCFCQERRFFMLFQFFNQADLYMADT